MAELNVNQVWKSLLFIEKWSCIYDDFVWQIIQTGAKLQDEGIKEDDKRKKKLI